MAPSLKSVKKLIYGSINLTVQESFDRRQFPHNLGEQGQCDQVDWMIEKKDPSHQSYTQQTESCVSPIHLNYAHVRVNQHREAIEKNSDECSSQTPTDVASTKNIE